MVNYHDPIVVAQDYLAMSKVWHVAAGLYFWEFITTLDYEWSVFRRRLRFRWTIWVYFTTRIATLMAIVLSLVSIDVTARYNCEVVIIFELAFAFLSAAAASLLIVLRIFAIWNMKKIIAAIAAGVWGTSIIFQIQTIARTRIESTPEQANCVVANPRITKLNALIILPTHIILLLIMFFGLFRLRFHKSSAFGMGRLLWRQALIWLLAAIIADILPVVFICLNLNDPLDNMFLIPSIVTLTIAATRIYRGLVDYGSVEYTEQLICPTEPNGHAEQRANRAPIPPTQLSRMEAAIRETYKQDETPQTTQNDPAGSLIDVEGQLYEKPAGQHKLDGNAENGMGSPTESLMT